MIVDPGRLRAVPVALLAVMALAIGAPVAPAAANSPACRVRNVTQGTRDDSFRKMVAAAHTGDRLRVGGTCIGGVTIRKDLVIRGVGPEATLTGRGAFRVVDIMARKDRRPHVRIGDIRIVRGRARVGGGIRVRYASLTLTDSVVRGNAAGYGGGIAVRRGTAHLRRVVLRANRAHVLDPWGDYGASGGGLWARSSRVTVTDSMVRDNRSALVGGGIHQAEGSAMTLIDTTVQGNRADHGGGISNDGVSLVIRNSIVAANHAGGVGGGLYNDAGTATIEGSRVTANTAGSGGGILNSGSLMIRRSRVAGNVVEQDGGGIRAFLERPGASIEISDSTVSGNRAGWKGGGMALLYDAPGAGVTLTDTTVRANRAEIDGGGLFVESGSDVALTGSSSVTGNEPNDCVGTPAC